MITISGSVGLSARNKPVDVMIVQHLLNLNHSDAGLTKPLPVDGALTVGTLFAIEEFQERALGRKKPDVRVDPGGATLAKLATPVKTKDTISVLRSVIRAVSSTTLSRPGEVSSGLGTISSQTFLLNYDRQFAQLNGAARAGLVELVDFINADMEMLDVGWAAYMLATVKHECAERWKPIEEFGKGAGRAYGNPVTVTDSEGNKHTNTYYGRGYVQLTWRDNYARMGRALGLGEELVIRPELALDPATSYAIMSYGMRNGSFTGSRLSDHINQHKCDYPKARKIINGLDQHTKIAGYAVNIEMLLRVSCYSSISDSGF